MHTCAIVNPIAGRGQVRRLWSQLLSRLLAATAPLSVRWTTGPRHATALVRQALANGCDRVVAVGGDGTLYEVVNGFFDDASPVRPGAVPAVVPCGSEDDFRYALGMPAGLAATGRLGHGRVRAVRVRAVDVPRVRHSSPDDRRGLRHAINIAAVGLSGSVVRRLSPGARFVPPGTRDSCPAPALPPGHSACGRHGRSLPGPLHARRHPPAACPEPPRRHRQRPHLRRGTAHCRRRDAA